MCIRDRYRLLCDNTIDEKITDLLSEKQAVFDAFADKSVAAENVEIDTTSLKMCIRDSNQTVGWFYSKGSDEYNDGSLTGMTLDDATKLCDEYLAEKADLNLIYLINYIPSN